MHTYRFHTALAGPFFALARGTGPGLTADALVQALTGVVVRELVTAPQGGYDVELRLDRQSHEDALAEIEAVLGQLGFAMLQALITEWTTSAIEGAVLGAAAGGAGMGSLTKDPVSAVLAAVLVGGVGAIVGSTMETVKARFTAEKAHPFGGGWQVTQITPAGTDLGPEPA